MTRAQRARLKGLFLEKFAEFGSVTFASAEAGIDRRLHYKWVENDPRYREAFHEADERLTDSLIHEAVIRGRDGKPKPIVYKGQIMGRFVDVAGKTVARDDPDLEIKAERFIPLTVTEYSDDLLKFIIKARCPAYRDNYREAILAPPDGTKTADEEFAEMDARAKAAAGPKRIDDAQIVEAHGSCLSDPKSE